MVSILVTLNFLFSVAALRPDPGQHSGKIQHPAGGANGKVLEPMQPTKNSMLKGSKVTPGSPDPFVKAHMQHNHSDAWQSAWTNPILLGITLGIAIGIGPDHFGTLAALSTGTSGCTSFMVGFSWGLGHSFGTILVLPVFYLCSKLPWASWVSFDHWEYWGDYLVGLSMVLIAMYFVAYESDYLEEQEDGSVRPKPCGCDGCEPGADTRAKFCAAFGMGKQKAEAKKEAKLECASSEQGTLRHPRTLQGAVVGVFQGFCCPMALGGMGFMARMGITNPLTIFIFSLIFVVTSSLGSAVLTSLWGALTARGMGNSLSIRTIYRWSCFLTFALGSVWIIANFSGVLHQIDFGEKLAMRIVGEEASLK